MPALSESIIGILQKEIVGISDVDHRIKIFCAIIKPITIDEKAEVFEKILSLHKYSKEDKGNLRYCLLDLPLIRKYLGKNLNRDLLISVKKNKYIHLFYYLEGEHRKHDRLTDGEKDFLAFRDVYSITDTPLGRKKEMARRITRRLIDRFVFDQEPSVVSNLLINPHLLEQDVLKIASLRPTNGAISLAIMRDKKWAAYYHVKKAIIFNPYTPSFVSVVLLPTLNNIDLKSLLKDKFVSPSVGQSANLLMEKRGSGVNPKKL